MVEKIIDKVEKNIDKNVLKITNDQVPGLDDFNVDDDVEIKVKARIINILKPEQKENETKSVEPAIYTIEIIESELLNKKEDRKNSERLGLDNRDYKQLQSKRGIQ